MSNELRAGTDAPQQQRCVRMQVCRSLAGTGEDLELPLQEEPGTQNAALHCTLNLLWTHVAAARVPAGVSQHGRYSEDVELPLQEEPGTSRGLHRQGSVFRRGQMAGISAEARLGSVLSVRQPHAVPMLQVRFRLRLPADQALQGNSHLSMPEICPAAACWTV